MAYELFIDGFDYYATANITKKWQSNYLGFIQSGSGRRGTSALGINTNLASSEVISKALSPHRYITIGFALYIPSNSNSAFRLYIYSSSTRQFRFEVTNTFLQWEAYREGAAMAARTTKSMSYDVWQYVEIAVDLADAGSYELRVNGSSDGWFPQTSYDTLVTAGGKITGFSVGRPASGGAPPTIYVDDLYALIGDEIKFLGDSRVDTLALTANSTPQDWTPDTGNAWERLNQDAGYISSDTVNATSLFAAGNLSHNPATIHGVQINGHAYKTDAGSREAAMVLKSGTTTDVGTSLALSTDTLLIREPHIVNPDTGVAFTKSGVDNLEVGVKVTA